VKPHGLPRERRVRSRADFQRAYAEGTKVVTRLFVLFARKNGGEISRLGVTATRKTGNAVVRNRARRLVKEAFRGCRAQLPEGLDLVVVVRPPLLAAAPEQIAAALIEASARATEARR
jgi:ribonuclease P protein component